MNVSTEDELEALVQPPEPQELSIPEPLKFAPWHRPRKQFVRKEQWMRHILGILAKLRENGEMVGDRPFKYLTLPGPDLLDVKLVADLCGANDAKLHYLGFCQAGEQESSRLRRNVSEFSISRSESIAPGSKVVLAPLQDVQRTRSEASVSMTSSGTFDAVNIDACDPIAKEDKNSTGRLIDSIRSITEHQIANRRSPWMLFLTTPVQTDTISEESLTAIKQQIEQNTQADEEFAQELAGHFSDGEDLASYMARTSAENGQDLLSLVSLGLTKWLIHLSEQARFRVKIMRSYSYSIFRREPFEPNMVSLCFLFEPAPLPIVDETGLTENPAPNPANTPGISDHIRALRKSISIENVDTLLEENVDLKLQMTEETKEMLRSAGYPVDDPNDGYDAWEAGPE
ncbi:hypothetical protein [Ruegeria sp. HKCCE3926]|uniref:PP_RS20740 family protein n=1 Tax=Ruegeria sp. HKCCE3926 TaxID=2794831 RepID=UPI001AE24685|nr:hypothetical protein [Ruegeria sp. HKCCE3926]